MSNQLQAYEPRGAAAELFTRRDPEILIEGPAGTGKTRGVLEKINGIMCVYPRSRGVLIRKTRSSMTQTILVTFEEQVLLNNPELYPQTTDVLRRNRQSYLYPNGSELYVVGMDNPDRIMSGEFDVAGFFEGTEGTLDDLEKITTRLRYGMVPYQQLIVDVNPSSPTHFLNRRATAKQMVRLLSRHQDNPKYWNAEANDWTPAGLAYISKLDALTGARKERLRHGRWAQAEGVVYENFDAKRNLIKPFEIPASWRRVRSIDFGYTNPFVCQWWAIDGDGRMFMYRELYGTKRRVEEWAADIKRLSGNERFEATVADHDAEDRATLHANGVQTTPAMKAIEPGIQAVEGRLAVADDGRSRLFIFEEALANDVDHLLVEDKKPTATEQEIEAYSWPKGIDGKPRKEVPVDADNHGMDAMRYAVAHVDNVSRTPFNARVIGGGGSSSNPGNTTAKATPARRDDHLWTKL